MFRGTVIAQIIGILGSLYLAKLYGVDAYGVFGVFVSIVSIFSIINTLQLEKNIVTSKTIFSSKNWYRFLILSIPFVSSLLLFVLYILSENNLLKKIDHQIILWSFLGCIAVSYFTINESLFTFRKKFKILSNSRILLTIINVSIQVFLYTQYSLYGLIYGYVASQLIVVLFFYLKNIKFVGIPNFKLIQEELKSNNTIIKYLLPGNAINGFAIHLMPILLLTFFSETQAGVYFFTTKLLSAPLFLISSSVSQVYFQKASELYYSNKADILRLTKKIVRGNLVLMFIILLIINTLGIYLLELYLDSNWKDVRIFTLLLSFLILARTSFNPISSLIIILNKNHISLIFNIYLFLINLIAIYVGYINNDIILTIIILSLLGGIGYLVLLFYFFKVLKNLEDA